jgi:hypothetical protein
MAEKAVYEILSNNTDVADMVNTQIVPLSAAQIMVLPFIVYSVTDYEPYLTQSAIVGGKTTVSITTYAETYRQAALLQTKIQKALAFQKGTFAGLPVKAINTQGKAALSEESGEGSEKPIYGMTQDYTVLHGER